MKSKTQIIQSLKQNKYLATAFVLLIVVYLAFDPRTPTIEKINAENIQADTLIPKGHVLVPVQLANFETISGLVDHFGVVDLYLGGQAGTQAKKIATRVKMIRAPLNPNQFAVLVTDSMATIIMRSGGPFWAVLQNRTVDTKEIPQQPQPAVKSVQIEYQSGG